jgi:hypothetical protein
MNILNARFSIPNQPSFDSHMKAKFLAFIVLLIVCHHTANASPKTAPSPEWEIIKHDDTGLSMSQKAFGMFISSERRDLECFIVFDFQDASVDIPSNITLFIENGSAWFYFNIKKITLSYGGRSYNVVHEARTRPGTEFKGEFALSIDKDLIKSILEKGEPFSFKIQGISKAVPFTGAGFLKTRELSMIKIMEKGGAAARDMITKEEYQWKAERDKRNIANENYVFSVKSADKLSTEGAWPPHSGTATLGFRLFLNENAKKDRLGPQIFLDAPLYRVGNSNGNASFSLNGKTIDVKINLPYHRGPWYVSADGVNKILELIFLENTGDSLLEVSLSTRSGIQKCRFKPLGLAAFKNARNGLLSAEELEFEKISFDTSAEDMADIYKENGVNGDLKYKGKRIRIKGRVDRISKNPTTGNPYIDIYAGYAKNGDMDGWLVRCEFGDRATKLIADASPLDEIIIEGDGGGTSSAYKTSTCMLNCEIIGLLKRTR